jgi:hypothetical protein
MSGARSASISILGGEDGLYVKESADFVSGAHLMLILSRSHAFH